MKCINDINGDGYADLLAAGNSSLLETTLGGVASLSVGPTLKETQSGSGFGISSASIGAVGDINGDGYDDVIVGAPFEYRSGVPKVRGDVDGDGRQDVLVGAGCAPSPQDQCNNGTAYLFKGKDGGLPMVADQKWVGPDVCGHFAIVASLQPTLVLGEASSCNRESARSIVGGGRQAADAEGKVVSEGGRGWRPGGVRGKTPPPAQADPGYVPRAGVDADQAWARQRIRNHFAANKNVPYTPPVYTHPPIQRKAEQSAVASNEGQGHEAEHGPVKLSQPGEPAEVEADGVADRVADQLHGGGQEEAEGHAAPGTADGAPAKAEAAGGAAVEADQAKTPQIGANLAGIGRKIFLARPNRDPATPRHDLRQVPGSVTTQQGVEIQVRPGALNHILGGHTVENFDPVARLGEIGPGTTTSLFPPGFATNAPEVVTLVKQALGNKAARNFEPAQRSIEVELRKVRLEIWVGPVGNRAPGAYMLNSCFPIGGVQLTYAEVQRYAQQVQNGSRTIQQVRIELLGRFR